MKPKLARHRLYLSIYTHRQGDMLPSGEATDQQLHCLSEAFSKWDAELNRRYNDLEQLLDIQGKQVFQDAQLEWIRYRDAEFELIKVVYPPQALINRILAASKKMK